jgi:hypothetical protein
MYPIDNCVTDGSVLTTISNTNIGEDWVVVGLHFSFFFIATVIISDLCDHMRANVPDLRTKDRSMQMPLISIVLMTN